jgi:hypothetical protein
MKHLSTYIATALLISSGLAACGGDSFSNGDGDAVGDGDGDTTGDGDGDTVGDGDGDTVGDGDTSGDGDVGCTELAAYGLNVIVRGGASDSGARDAAPPQTGGATNLILPPDPSTGGAFGTGGAMGTGGETNTDGCAAVVTATEGEYTETLDCIVSGIDCQCFGAVERAGTYAVTGTLGDLVETETGIVVEADECHVIAENVTLFD